MKKILLIRRIQKDNQWQDDCYDIACAVVRELNYSFPCREYYELFKEGFSKYIAEHEINLSQPINLDDLYYELFRQGYDYALKYEDDAEYFEFDLTKEDKVHIEKLILKYTLLFYKYNKVYLIKGLKKIDNDVVIIYPREFYSNILKTFYRHQNPTFKSNFNNDEDCINEYLQATGTTDYIVVKI
ncbi:MAG TPA: hypothetical protein DCL21_05005 [Alphaproteobacteria bacterium]|mgnify:CR=1 FL=1|nr:hypothetical protein [Alphaproteobacteria bacterium]